MNLISPPKVAPFRLSTDGRIQIYENIHDQGYVISARPRNTGQSGLCIRDSDLFGFEGDIDAIQIKTTALYSQAEIAAGGKPQPWYDSFDAVQMVRVRIHSHRRAPGSPAHHDNLQVIGGENHGSYPTYYLEDVIFDNTGYEPYDVLFQDGQFGEIHMKNVRCINTHQGIKLSQKNPAHIFPHLILENCQDLPITLTGHRRLLTALTIKNCKNIILSGTNGYEFQLIEIDTERELEMARKALSAVTQDLMQAKRLAGDAIALLENI